ncbi:MAG: hypothetical protein ISS43_04955 [Candidatus Omnitrophica bacterium]|nr:hypothetical protein [Candidatus Omnitrophota bacterium]
MQKKDSKRLTVLIALIAVAIFTWWPKKEMRKALVLPEQAPVSFEKAKPMIEPGQRKRTEFADWGRNPFVWPKGSPGIISGLRLSGIIWDSEGSYVVINGEIAYTGDKIDGKTLKRIEPPDKVILSDGLTDYVLELE